MPLQMQAAKEEKAFGARITQYQEFGIDLKAEKKPV
jgi:hypothetical protein